jgi:hypothetical protein
LTEGALQIVAVASERSVVERIVYLWDWFRKPRNAKLKFREKTAEFCEMQFACWLARQKSEPTFPRSSSLNFTRGSVLAQNTRAQMTLR